MRTIIKRATAAAVLAFALTASGFAGLVPGGLNPAHAAGFTENWQCAERTHVAYNPVTGEPVEVGHLEWILVYWNPPVAMWACVDTGGTAGSHSVGTYGQFLGGYASYVQVTSVCPGVDSMGCTGVFTGFIVDTPDGGTVGIKPCVITGVSNPCASVGATIDPSVPFSYSLPEPGPGEICGPRVLGVCEVKRLTVQTGGHLATVYVGTTPVDLSVPASCVEFRPGLTLLVVRPGSGC
jgi:hypothetical protein